MTDRRFLNGNIASAPFHLFDRPSNKIFVRILFAFNRCYVILTEWAFYYFVMCKCMRPTFCINGTIQYVFLSVTRLLDCNTCTLTFSALKLENGLKKHVRNVTEIKCGFAK